MKKCVRCLGEKDFSEFYKDSKSSDGLGYSCIACQRKYYSFENDPIRFNKYKAKKKEYMKKMAEHKANYDKEYRALKKEAIKEYKKEWEKKNKDNPIFKIKRNLRRRLHHVIKGYLKADNTFNLVGCSAEDFKKYIETLFSEGMNWDNYGVGGWHIDHIIPCSAFDMSIEEDQRKCFHYTNCQPLWEKDNLKKAYVYKNQNCRMLKDKNEIVK